MAIPSAIQSRVQPNSTHTYWWLHTEEDIHHMHYSHPGTYFHNNTCSLTCYKINSHKNGHTNCTETKTFQVSSSFLCFWNAEWTHWGSQRKLNKQSPLKRCLHSHCTPSNVKYCDNCQFNITTFLGCSLSKKKNKKKTQVKNRFLHKNRLIKNDNLLGWIFSVARTKSPACVCALLWKATSLLRSDLLFFCVFFFAQVVVSHMAWKPAPSTHFQSVITTHSSWFLKLDCCCNCCRVWHWWLQADPATKIEWFSGKEAGQFLTDC